MEWVKVVVQLIGTFIIVFGTLRAQSVFHRNALKRDQENFLKNRDFQLEVEAEKRRQDQLKLQEEHERENFKRKADDAVRVLDRFMLLVLDTAAYHKQLILLPVKRDNPLNADAFVQLQYRWHKLGVELDIYLPEIKNQLQQTYKKQLLDFPERHKSIHECSLRILDEYFRFFRQNQPEVFSKINLYQAPGELMV